MATTKNESFKNLTEYLKKLKELDDTAVKNSSLIDELKSSTLFSAAGNKEPTTKIEEKSSPASLDKFNEKLLKKEEDKDKIFNEINDNLKEIKKALQGNTPDKKVGGGPGRSDTSPGALPKADNLTFTEKLKSAVAGVKGVGNKVMGLGEKVVGATTGTVEGLISDPKGFARKAFGSLKSAVSNKANSIGNYVKDVASTKSDYTPEQERFAKIAVQANPDMNMTKAEAEEAFNKIQAKSGEIEQHKAEMDKFKEQGFEPTDDQKNKLNDLQKELAAVDPRVKKDDTDKREAKVESKQERDVSEQALAASNPNADNVESSSEKISKEIAENNKTISSLLAVATSQLTSLNAIKDALIPSNPKEQEAKGQKPREPEVAPAPAAEGGSMLGDIASTASDFLGKGKGLGGKVLGGLGKAAKFLGPAAAVAGAAYSGFQGYQNTNENFDLKQGEEATTGQKVSSTLGGVASGLTFGLLDEKSASQGIHKAGSAVKDFFGFGDKEKPSDSKATESGGSDLEALQAKRDKLAKQGPATDSPQSILAHRDMLGSLDKAIEDKKNSKPSDGRSARIALREGGRRTTFGSLDQDTTSLEKQADNLSDQATKLGIDPNNATGTYEGGVLTKITDKVSGKEHQIAVPEESKARVEAARNLKSSMGSEVAKTSTENKDMERDASSKGGANNTVVSNNVSSNNTTKYVPMKASPRPESQGSALDRYQNRITTF